MAAVSEKASELSYRLRLYGNALSTQKSPTAKMAERVTIFTRGTLVRLKVSIFQEEGHLKGNKNFVMLTTR